jgi:hypothetical protein
LQRNLNPNTKKRKQIISPEADGILWRSLNKNTDNKAVIQLNIRQWTDGIIWRSLNANTDKKTVLQLNIRQWTYGIIRRSLNANTDNTHIPSTTLRFAQGKLTRLYHILTPMIHTSSTCSFSPFHFSKTSIRCCFC